MRGSIIHNGEFFSLRESSCLCDGAPLSAPSRYICAPFNIIFTVRRTKRTAPTSTIKRIEREKKKTANDVESTIQNVKYSELFGLLENQEPSALETGECHRL
jgi:hypothetical protein